MVNFYLKPIPCGKCEFIEYIEVPDPNGADFRCKKWDVELKGGMMNGPFKDRRCDKIG